MTVGFFYGPGAETLIFVTGTSGEYPKVFVSRQKTKVSCGYPENPKKIGVWVSGAEIQTSAVDTRIAVWVSTAENFPKSFWEKLGIFLESLGGSQRQLCIKTQPLLEPFRDFFQTLEGSRLARDPGRLFQAFSWFRAVQRDSSKSQTGVQLFFPNTTACQYRWEACYDMKLGDGTTMQSEGFGHYSPFLGDRGKKQYCNWRCTAMLLFGSSSGWVSGAHRIDLNALTIGCHRNFQDLPRGGAANRTSFERRLANPTADLATLAGVAFALVIEAESLNVFEECLLWSRA